MKPVATGSDIPTADQGAVSVQTPHTPIAVVAGPAHPPLLAETVAGVDVSAYQGSIDWLRVRRAGYRFAACKATEGTGFRDPTFGANWAGLKRAGMVRFAYHFMHPGVDPHDAVDKFHKYVRVNGGFWPGDGVLFDWEVTDGLTPDLDILRAKQWVAYAARTIARPIFMYTGTWFWSGQLGDPTESALSTLPLWLASYGASPTVPHAWPAGLSVWQYSDTGTVPGIPFKVDLDHFYGSMAQLRHLLR